MIEWWCFLSRKKQVRFPSMWYWNWTGFVRNVNKPRREVLSLLDTLNEICLENKNVIKIYLNLHSLPFLALIIPVITSQFLFFRKYFEWLTGIYFYEEISDHVLHYNSRYSTGINVKLVFYWSILFWPNWVILNDHILTIYPQLNHCIQRHIPLPATTLKRFGGFLNKAKAIQAQRWLLKYPRYHRYNTGLIMSLVSNRERQSTAKKHVMYM